MKFNILLTALVLLSGAENTLHSQNDPGSTTRTEPWKRESNTEKSLEIVLARDTLSRPPGSADRKIAQWWELFGYPELTSLTKLALAENPEIKTGESRVKESEARLKLARSYLYPSLSFNPSFMRQEFSANRPMPFETAPQSVINNTYALPLDVSYEIDITGKLVNRTQSSAYNLQASTAMQENLELSIAAQVAKNYALLLTLDTESKILERTIATRQQNLEIVEARYSAGLTNEIDLQRAKTELSSVAVQLKNNQLQRTQTELELAALCGVSPSSFSIDKNGFQYLAPVVVPASSETLGARRPDIQAAKYSIKSYEKQLKSARKELLPSLYINGSAGLLSGASDQVFENDSRNWLVGATLSVPIFEGGRRRALLAINKHQLEAATEHLNREKISAAREMENALSDLWRLNEQLAIQQEFLAAAQKAALLSQQRYKQGLVTYLEVVDAERIVLEAERLLAQLLGRQLVSTIDLIVASGGKLTE